MREIAYTAQLSDAGRTVGYLLHARLHVSDRSIKHAKYIEGAVRLDGALSRCDAPVAPGQVVSIVVDDWLEPHEPSVAAECAPEGALDIAYEDDDLLIVNKAAGSVVHPCPGHWEHTLGNYVVGYLYGKREAIDLHAVNRLDIGTSGLVVFAKNGHVQERLKEQMHTGAFQREYLAVCKGVPSPACGMIDAPIGRATAAPVSSFAAMEGGKQAITHYAVVEELSDVESEGVGREAGGTDANHDGIEDMDEHAAAAPTIGATGTVLVRLVLETGRTHQIRVHMAHIGHPLVGDALYGGPSGLLGRPALHSWKLDLVQPITGKEIHLEVEPPEDFAGLVDALRHGNQN